MAAEGCQVAGPGTPGDAHGSRSDARAGTVAADAGTPRASPSGRPAARRPPPPTAKAPHMLSSLPANSERVVREWETPAYKHTPHAPTP